MPLCAAALHARPWRLWRHGLTERPLHLLLARFSILPGRTHSYSGGATVPSLNLVLFPPELRPNRRRKRTKNP